MSAPAEWPPANGDNNNEDDAVVDNVDEVDEDDEDDEEDDEDEDDDYGGICEHVQAGTSFCA